MSKKGMKEWMTQERLDLEFLQEDGELKPEWRKVREHHNQLLDQGKTPDLILTEKCRGREHHILMLAMVLIEDRGMAVSELSRTRLGGYRSRGYCPAVGSYLRHTGGGGRALPARGETEPIVRRKELAGARR